MLYLRECKAELDCEPLVAASPVNYCYVRSEVYLIPKDVDNRRLIPESFENSTKYDRRYG